jgi:hypothetical protein
MKLERHYEPLLPTHLFLRRLLSYGGLAALFLLGSLSIGVLGYHAIAHLGWVDSIQNACMILAGMGPVDAMTTNSAKLFASVYAIFSGVAFLSSVSVFLTPVAHRVLHLFHLVGDDESRGGKR